MGCAVWLTPTCITSWFVCSLHRLIITWSISTSLISRGTVESGVLLKPSSGEVTIIASRICLSSLCFIATQNKEKQQKNQSVLVLWKFLSLHQSHVTSILRKWPLGGNASSHKSLHDLYPTCVHHQPRLHTNSKTGNLLCSSLSRRQCICWVER